MLQGEREKLLQMEEQLHNKVIGQDEAVVAVANAIRRFFPTLFMIHWRLSC